MKKNVNLDTVEKEMLNKINSNDNTNKKIINKKKSNSKLKFENIIVILIISLTFLLIGFCIGQMKDTNKNNFTVNKDIQKIVEEYNYILDNYYGEIDNDKLITGAINGMLSTLDDYSGFLGNENDNLNIHLKGEYIGLGIGVLKNKDGQVIISSVYENSPAFKANIMVNDIVNKINGEALENLDIKNILEKIKISDSINLELLRENKIINATLKKETIELKSTTLNILNEDIAYIKVDLFAENTDEQFKKIINDIDKKNIKNLIIDLRNNSGGHLNTVKNMISEFVSNKNVIFQTEDKSGIEKYYSSGKIDKDYNIVILQNNLSASASEVMTSALKNLCNAYIIGEKSYGKGTVQGVQNVADLGKYKMTTKKWLTSLGGTIDKIGIIPDKKIELDPIYYTNPTIDNDNQLAEALNFFKKED